MIDTPFSTATMAKVYADQGYFEKAIDIYRHLLRLEPDREELRAALRALEQKVKDNKEARGRDLAPLLEKWLSLVLLRRNIRKLQKLKNTTFNQT